MSRGCSFTVVPRESPADEEGSIYVTMCELEGGKVDESNCNVKFNSKGISGDTVATFGERCGVRCVVEIASEGAGNSAPQQFRWALGRRVHHWERELLLLSCMVFSKQGSNNMILSDQDSVPSSERSFRRGDTFCCPMKYCSMKCIPQGYYCIS